jgi:hypothetical protein
MSLIQLATRPHLAGCRAGFSLHGTVSLEQVGHTLLWSWHEIIAGPLLEVKRVTVGTKRAFFSPYRHTEKNRAACHSYKLF